MNKLNDHSDSHFDPAILSVFKNISLTLYNEMYVEKNKTNTEYQLDIVLKKYFTISFDTLP